jgi:hypothetical protein
MGGRVTLSGRDLRCGALWALAGTLEWLIRETLHQLLPFAVTHPAP